MKMFELLPRPLGSIFRKLTHLTCNSRRNGDPIVGTVIGVQTMAQLWLIAFYLTSQIFDRSLPSADFHVRR